MHSFKCLKCNYKFRIELAKNGSKNFILKSGELVNRLGKTGMSLMLKSNCPKCGGEARKIINFVGVAFDDDLKPQGFSTVAKRHEEGPFWDQSLKSLKETNNLNQEMKQRGEEYSKELQRQDEEKIAKEYRPVEASNIKEALDIAKHGDYK